MATKAFPSREISNEGAYEATITKPTNKTVKTYLVYNLPAIVSLALVREPLLVREQLSRKEVCKGAKISYNAARTWRGARPAFAVPSRSRKGKARARTPRARCQQYESRTDGGKRSRAASTPVSASYSRNTLHRIHPRDPIRIRESGRDATVQHATEERGVAGAHRIHE